LWAAATFVALNIGGLVVVDRWPLLRDPEYVRLAERLRARAAGDRAATLVVMLGSSRTQIGLRARSLEERLSGASGRPVVVFNFGMAGVGPVQQRITLGRLMHAELAPDVLLLEIHPALLDASTPEPPEARWTQLDRFARRELDALQDAGFPPARLDAERFLSWSAPLYRHRLSIVSLAAPAWLPWNIRRQSPPVDDWGPRVGVFPDAPEDRRRGLDLMRAEYHDWLRNARVGGRALAALEGALAACAGAGVRPIVVIMPESTMFRSWYSEALRASLDESMARLTRTYGAPVIDARTWASDDEFIDGHHLGPHGAAAFTDRLAAALGERGAHSWPHAVRRARE
jgi:hypothetical protein